MHTSLSSKAHQKGLVPLKSVNMEIKDDYVKKLVELVDEIFKDSEHLRTDSGNDNFILGYKIAFLRGYIEALEI